MSSVHMNSNDIFSQIGLVLEGQQSEETLNYTVYLEIELSQGNNEIISTNYSDDPHLIAVDFCKQHQLNELAVEIVQNKIYEAKEKEQDRLRQQKSMVSQMTNRLGQKSLRKKSQSPICSRSPRKSPKKLNHDQYVTIKDQKNSTLKQSFLSRGTERNALKSKSQTKTYKRKETSSKSEMPVKSKAPRAKKTEPSTFSNDLYTRAIIRQKVHQNQRQKYLQQKEQAEVEGLTFQPKINAVSAKIVEFRREQGADLENQRQKQNARLNADLSKVNFQIQEMKQCTFKPQINKVSDLISQNKSTQNADYDHFTALYRQAQVKQQKREYLQTQKSMPFQPTINTKSSDKIVDTFQQRLQKSLLRKKEIQEGNLVNQQCTFKPKITRGPRQEEGGRGEGGKREWWNALYHEKMKKSEVLSQINDSNVQQSNSVSNKTKYYYEQLVEKRIGEVFSQLDSDQDGYVSPQFIAIEGLTKHELVFLRPLFEEMDEIEAELDFVDFKKSVLLLLNDTDPHIRGQFLRQKHRDDDDRPTFAPQINPKSREIMLSRVPTMNGTIYDQLYEQGLREMQKKEYYLQKEREKQEDKQLAECSFKPQLGNTSKYYIDKVLGKQAQEPKANHSHIFIQ